MGLFSRLGCPSILALNLSIFATAAYAQSPAPVPVPAPAPAPVDVCKLPSVKYLSVAVYPKRPSSKKKFNLAYQILEDKWTNPTLPTIIFVTGGPGTKTIDTFDEKYDETFPSPKNARVIQVEPRGSGCNGATLAGYPDTVYTTENLAYDTLAVLEDLRKQKQLDRYVIYGASYGTAVATTLASIIEKSKVLPKPESLVLTGTFGAPYAGTHDQGLDYAQEWEKLKKVLPESSRPALQYLRDHPEALGFDKATWGNFIWRQLKYGWSYWNTPDHPLVRWMGVLAAGKPDEIEQLKKTLTKHVKKTSEWTGLPIFAQITCAELSSAHGSRNVSLEGDRLTFTPSGSTMCEGRALTKPWYAMNFPVTVPIFYFHGLRDPATPMWQLEAHVNGQKHADRYALLSTKGGHGALWTSYLKCKEPIWESIYQGGKGFSDLPSQCKELTGAASTVRVWRAKKKRSRASP